RVLLAVRRDVPLPREVGDDALPVPRVASDQTVVHGRLRADVGHGARLMDVEVSRSVVHPVAEGAAALGRGIGPAGRRRLLGLCSGTEHGRAEGSGAGYAGGAKERASGQVVAAGAGNGLGHWTPPCGFGPRIGARGGGTIHDSPRGDKARFAMGVPRTAHASGIM